jgi:hypothetical protein
MRIVFPPERCEHLQYCESGAVGHACTEAENLHTLESTKS